MFDATPSVDGRAVHDMDTDPLGRWVREHDLLDRDVALDVLVNVVPVVILLSFVVLFLVHGSYPADPVVVVVQVSLIAVPPLLLAVLTYYAVRAVTDAERSDSPDLPPGYTREDAETAATRGGPARADDD